MFSQNPKKVLVRKESGQLRVKSREENENQGLKDVVKKALTNMGRMFSVEEGGQKQDEGSRRKWSQDTRRHACAELLAIFLFFFPSSSLPVPPLSSFVKAVDQMI